jgi:hypothetical protein
MEIKLGSLALTIVRCWERAEAATATVIAAQFPHPCEEEITFLFGGKLRSEVDEASRKRSFELALLTDLELNYPRHMADSFARFRGLIARVNFHSRAHEGLRSGADVGVVITRPSICVGTQPGSVTVVRDSPRALMAQAKLGKAREEGATPIKWGQLTERQKHLIPAHSDYYALLLYRLIAGHTLAPFRWQLCCGRTADEINDWLCAGRFPGEVSSGDVIHALSTGRLGSDSQSVIDSFVDPSASHARAVEIRVFWPEGKGPDGRMLLQFRERQQARQFAAL